MSHYKSRTNAYSTSSELNLSSHVFAIQNVRPVFSTDHMYYNTSKVIFFLTYRGITKQPSKKHGGSPDMIRAKLQKRAWSFGIFCQYLKLCFHPRKFVYAV